LIPRAKAPHNYGTHPRAPKLPTVTGTHPRARTLRESLSPRARSIATTGRPVCAKRLNPKTGP
jgi:hypothetical protein